jgi:hypothetical protein
MVVFKSRDLCRSIASLSEITKLAWCFQKIKETNDIHFDRANIVLIMVNTKITELCNILLLLRQHFTQLMNLTQNNIYPKPQELYWLYTQYSLLIQFQSELTYEINI